MEIFKTFLKFSEIEEIFENLQEIFSRDFHFFFQNSQDISIN